MDLIAANERLLALQAEARRRRAEQAEAQPPIDAPPIVSPPADEARPAVVPELPPHLGWESEAVTAILRRSRAPVVEDPPSPPPPIAPPIIEERIESTPSQTAVLEHLRVYPTMTLALIDQDLVAVGRLWLLMRALDPQGGGWVDLDVVRKKLTHKESDWRICGKRHLRHLLQEGEGVFWERDRRRVWLRSLVNVAVELGIERMAFNSVAMPVAGLLGSVGDVRAQFYASLHSARKGTPISRDALAEVTGVPRRTQIEYDKRARTAVTPNFAIGQVATPINVEEASWQRGMAVFVLEDKRGVHGVAGRKYVAWQLGNSYDGPHERLGRGHRKRINRRLGDLQVQRVAGNVRPEKIGKLYFADAKTAVRANQETAYWKNGRWWYCLEEERRH